MSVLGLPLPIRGVGARTAWATGAARSAHGVRIAARSVAVARIDGKVRRVALSRGVRGRLRGPDRLIEIAAPALREAAASHPGGPVALILALPEVPAAEASTLLHQVAIAAGVSLDRRHSQAIAAGPGAGLLALTRAVALLGGARGPAHVVVGGVASPIAYASEVGEDEEGLVARGARRRGPTAGLLGEGAGFLALSARGEAAARLVALEVLDGDAPKWRPALRALLAGGAIDRVIADLDVGGVGGVDLADACETVLGAAKRALEAGGVLGDLGAAAPAVLVALAMHAPPPPGRVVLATGAGREAPGLLVVARDAVDPPVEAERAPAAPSAAARAAWLLWQDLAASTFELRSLARQADAAEDVIGPAMSAASTCDVALRALGRSDLWDPMHLARLDAAAASLDALGDALPTAEHLVALDDDAAAVEEVLAASRGEAEAGASALRRVRPAVVARAATIDLARDRVRGEAPRRLRPAVLRAPVLSPPLLPTQLDAETLQRAAAHDDAPEPARQLRGRELATVEVLELLRGARVARGSGPAWEAREPPLGFSPIDLDALGRIDATMDELLAAIDAVACPESSVDRGSSPGDAAPAIDLVAVVEAACPPQGVEPSSAFARSFVLGSCDDEEAAHRAVAALDRAPGPVHGALADGLALARGPHVDAAIDARLVREHDERRLVALARAASARRAVRVGVFALHAVSGSAPVRAAVAAGLGVAGDRAAATAALIAAARAEGDPAALTAQLEALVRLGAPEGLARARIVVDDGDLEPGPFLRLLALGGRLEDADRLLRHPTEEWSLRGLGWLGFAPLVDVLVGVLELEHRRSRPDERSATARAAALALQRITAVTATAGKLAWKGRFTVDQRDLETSPRVWREHLARSPIDPRARLRFGQPYEPPASLEEIAATNASNRDRLDAALEAGARSGGALRPRDPFDDARLQRLLLDSVRSR